MSEHETTSRSAPVVVLSDDEIERALGRTVDRGRGLVRRRQRRRAAVGILGAAVLLAGGFGIISSLSDDPAGVVVTPAGRPGGKTSGPAASTTTAPSVPAPSSPRVPGAPAGFTRSELGDGRVRIENDGSVTDDQPVPTTTITPDGVAIDLGTAASEVFAAEVLGSERLDDHTLRISYECDPTTTHVDSVTYRLTGSVVEVQVRLLGVTPVGCVDEGVVDLYFPDETLPADVRAETTRFDD